MGFIFTLDFWSSSGYTSNNLKPVSDRSTVWKRYGNFSWLKDTREVQKNYRHGGCASYTIPLMDLVLVYQCFFFSHPIDSGVRIFFDQKVFD
jgi:hypothetical protein